MAKITRETKYIKFFEKKGRYKTNRVGFIITEDDEDFVACYCKADEIKNTKIQMASFDKSEFEAESCGKEHAEKVLKIGMINIDRQIDSLQFDLDEMTSIKNKYSKILKLKE